MLQSVHTMDILSTMGMRDAGFLDRVQQPPPPPQQAPPPPQPRGPAHMYPSLAPGPMQHREMPAEPQPLHAAGQLQHLPVQHVPSRPPAIMLPTIRHGRIGSSTSSSPGTSPVVVAQRPALQPAPHERQVSSHRLRYPLSRLQAMLLLDAREGGGGGGGQP